MKFKLAFITAACLSFNSFADMPKTCTANFANDLVGRQFPSGKVVDLERRLNNLQLKMLGGSELSNDMFAQSFNACGAEFMALLDKRAKIRDVIAVPYHSKQFPESLGPCAINGIKSDGDILTILTNQDGQDTLKADFARKINTTTAKFKIIPVDSLRCFREFIFTKDGGR